MADSATEELSSEDVQGRAQEAFSEGLRMLEGEHPAEAVTAFTRALEAYRTLPEAQRDQASCLNGIGNAQRTTGRDEEALDHVLGGVISPIDGIGPDQLHISELIDRLRRDRVKEVILATNASVEGESIALYIQRQLEEAKLADLMVSRLARGIPIGVDLEYADKITLGHALSDTITWIQPSHSNLLLILASATGAPPL